MPLPESIINAPELFKGLELYYEGFLDLTSCRSGSECPIAFNEILKYCEYYQFCDETAQDFIWIIQRLDLWYLEKFNERPRTEVPNTGG